MKKIFLPFLAAAGLAAGCGGDAEDQVIVPVNTCANAADFSVTQQSGNVLLSVTDSNDPLYYQVSAIIAQSDNNPEYGTMLTLNSTSESVSATDLNLYPGQTYLIYVRSFCDDNNKSAWSAPKTLQFADYCGSPTDLGMTLTSEGIAFKWNENDEATSHYQVAFGVQGFTLGSGTIQNTNSLYFAAPMMANTTYDFYVRSFCTAGTGWSSWSGPYTYFSEYNQNLCTQPSNVHYTQLSPSQANFTWSYNGESNFEYALVGGSQTISNATIYTIGTGGTPTFTGLSNWAQYTFYVRAVCANGNRTPWSTILVDLN